jgi:radical SAM superfamily enzyme YgiQ (UPF0313 family)
VNLMKIVLLMPQSDRYGKNGAFGERLRYAPLTLTTLAGLIPDDLKANTVLIDEWNDDFDPHTIEADIVGITVITGNAPKAYSYAKVLRDRGITTVLGGIHITLCPDEAEKNADSIVVGYAEEAWPELLRDFSLGKLRSRYDRQPETADGYPRPRRDMLNAKGFTTTNVVQATRGCKYKCTFCVVPSAWPMQYQRDPEDVAAEVAELPGKTFILIDLSPTSDEEYFGRLCDAFAPLNKYWGGLATLNITDNPKLVKKLSDSGCRGLLIGLESQNPKTLKVMGKKWQDPTENLWRIKMLHDHGIAINGCFVFGVDGDTDGVFDETLEFVFKAGIDLPRFAVATPFPGTPFYRMLEKGGRILTTNWEWYDGQHVVFQPQSMSEERLYEGIKHTWREAYTLSGVCKRLWSSTAVSHRSPITLATALSTNIGYMAYSGAYPKFMPIPCEGKMWFQESNQFISVKELS